MSDTIHSIMVPTPVSVSKFKKRTFMEELHKSTFSQPRCWSWTNSHLILLISFLSIYIITLNSLCAFFWLSEKAHLFTDALTKKKKTTHGEPQSVISWSFQGKCVRKVGFQANLPLIELRITERAPCTIFSHLLNNIATYVEAHIKSASETVWLAAIRGPGTRGCAMQIFLMVNLMGCLPKTAMPTLCLQPKYPLQHPSQESHAR